jgi:8-oxo-dGTP pyrophosphatase MutT (NUDIX family)
VSPESRPPRVEPKPAASVILVRAARPGAVEPLEVYLVRRQKGMRFLGGFYAFPGGKVDGADGASGMVARCYGLGADEAEAIFPGSHGQPALAFWVAAVRELVEETGLVLACDDGGRAVDVESPGFPRAAEQFRQALMAGEPFVDLLAASGWRCDVRPLRYFSHFVTPRSSPIRFSARFFLCPAPADQAPRLFTEETSEGFWMPPGEGYRRFRAREMAMAEPAEYGLAYLAQFGSLDELVAAHADRREKLHGLIHRIDFKLWTDFDWKEARWTTPPPGR